MERHSGSLLRRLELGFAVGAFVITGLMALFMDRALHLNLEAEDILVMQAQARSLAQGRDRSTAFREGRSLPEQSEWRILGPEGRSREQSEGFTALERIDWNLKPEVAVKDDTDPRRRLLKIVLPLPGGERLQMAMDRGHEGILVARFRLSLLLGLLASTLLAALGGRWVARRSLAPLDRMTREAGAIDPLRLQHRLDPALYPAELQQLVGTMNLALDRIQGAFDNLGRFAGELAHEFRTPLQNLRGEVESMLRRPDGSAETGEALGSMLEECERLAALVEQTLFLARTEDPSAALARESIPVRPFLERMASFFEASAEEKGVELRVAASQDLFIRADKALLERALANLLSNAIRHTPAGGSVELLGLPVPEGCTLRILDTGPGVDAQLLERLGQPWVKGPGRNRHGLGLAIVRGILKLHGGTVEFHSPAEGGLRVTLNFPE